MDLPYWLFLPWGRAWKFSAAFEFGGKVGICRFDSVARGSWASDTRVGGCSGRLGAEPLGWLLVLRRGSCSVRACPGLRVPTPTRLLIEESSCSRSSLLGHCLRVKQLPSVNTCLK